MENNFEFICEKCNYKTNIKGSYDAHLLTELHINGKRKQRSDKLYPKKCEKCNVMIKNKITEELHYLNDHASLEEREKNFLFYCKCCDYGSLYEDQFNKHKETNKHKKNELRHNNKKILNV